MLRNRIPTHLLVIVLAMSLIGLTACPKPKPPPDEPDIDTGPHYDGPEPIIRGVSPTSANEGEIVDLTVEGQYFRQGAEVYVGRTRAGNTSLVDGETLKCTAPKLGAGTYDVRVVNSDTSEATLTRAFRIEAKFDCSLVRVYFDYDKSELNSSARKALEDNARCIQEKGFTKVKIEGHADERGSTEYNLALGQRRADSVKKYLTNLGVSSSALRTISYGEEQPLENGAGEAIWSKNRRAELVNE